MQTGVIETRIPGRLDRLPWSRWHWARLVVHQNLPSPDTGTPIELIGQGIDGPTTP